MARVMENTPGPGARSGGRPAGAATAGALPFDVLAEIATGATARVDLCRVRPSHPRRGQLLAVKRLHPHVAEDPVFVNQFLDEVWMTAALRHPNVVEVAGWGADEQGSYLAVELVQGVSLARLMKTIFDTGEAFTERMVVYLGACICRGLAAAHALRGQGGELLNLVHRDLTPGNVLIGFTGEVKIADFGLAKAKQRLTRTLTGMRKGEPTYMAPEQARSDEIDARADLFSFGVVLYELFTGRRPWSGRSDIDMVQLMLREPPADLRALRPKIDRELVHVVMRCLERDPDARFQSAREVADRFDEWLGLHGWQEGNAEALGRFVRRNAMRQMRWFERAVAGELSPGLPPRDEPPRVPTFTDHSDGPGGLPAEPAPPEARPRVAIPAPPPPPARLGPQKPLVPPRLGAPLDPRALRAQNAVQQLKKIAPAQDLPRPRGEPDLPRLHEDDDGDETDVELKVGAARRSGAPDVPSTIVDEETGEEVPTLVQKDDPQVKAMRAEARREIGKPKPPYVSPGLIVDEESDQRITSVKREEQRAAHPGVVSIVDPETELPTEPVNPKRPAPLPADLRKTPPARPPLPSGDGHVVIPSLPVIPRGHAGDTGATRAPVPATLRAATLPEPPHHPRPMAVPVDPARLSQPDEVQVIDRDVLRQQVLHTEEGIVAEADRLAIEAVRRAEEARAAQLRAERKAAAAKMATEAARLAAEAVQLIRTAGIAAAARRLEDARAVEQGAQSARLPPGETHSGAIPLSQPTPGSVFPPPVSQPYADPFPGVDAARARAITGAAPPASVPPPPVSHRPADPYHDPGGPRPVAPTPAPPIAAPPISAPYAVRAPAPSLPPPSFGVAPPSAPASLPQGVAPPSPSSTYDTDISDRRDPKIFGLPPGALAALAVVLVFVVIAAAVTLAR